MMLNFFGAVVEISFASGLRPMRAKGNQ